MFIIIITVSCIQIKVNCLSQKMTDNLILSELQNMHECLTKTKEEHSLNFRLIKPTEKFNFCEFILNTKN